MGSFEWMEVETLSAEINALEARLDAAKSRHNYGLVKVVKEQIAAAHQRRARYLAHISTSLAESLDPAPHSETEQDAAHAPLQENPAEIAVLDQPSAELADDRPGAGQPELAEPDQPSAEPAEPIAQKSKKERAEPDRPSAEPAEPIAQEVPEEPAEPDQPGAEQIEPVAASAVHAPHADTIKGVTNVWDQLTPAHIERAKADLETRRVETLARHAEELKALDADQGQIDVLAQAIDTFLQKFNASAAGSVVRLDDERDRLQSNS